MSSDEAQPNIVAHVRGKLVSITGGSTRWKTNPADGVGFVNSVHAPPLESPASDIKPNGPRSLEEALAAMEARPAGAEWDYAEPTPRDVPFDIEIVETDGGYLVAYQPADGSVYGGDTWHATLDDAEEFAFDQFGVQAHEWQRGPLTTNNLHPKRIRDSIRRLLHRGTR